MIGKRLEDITGDDLASLIAASLKDERLNTNENCPAAATAIRRNSWQMPHPLPTPAEAT
jgi:hypothetical protein